MEEDLDLRGGARAVVDEAFDARVARLARLRGASAVAWEPDLDAWGVYRHAEVKRVCLDWEAFSSEHTDEGTHRSMLHTDPPRHADLRRVLAKDFTPGAVAKLEPRIRAITDELLAAALAKGRFDLVGDFAHPLPVTVIAELMGVPASERPRYRRWADAILGRGVATRLRGAPPTPEAQAARAEMDAWFTEEARRPGRADRDDLLGTLLSGRAGGEPLSGTEVLAFCALLLLAGHVTTVNLVANAVYCLLRFPDQRAVLVAERAHVPDAVEEVLRYMGPVQAVIRAATKPVTLGGVDIAAGQRVVAWLASAGRDPRVFPRPDRFDVRRKPNPHLAFGTGIHFCLGAPLARLEGRLALDALLDPLARLRPCDDDPPRLTDTGSLLGFDRFVLEPA